MHCAEFALLWVLSCVTAAAADTALCPTCTSQTASIDSDGVPWRSEALHAELGKQLKALGKLLTHPSEISPDRLRPLADAQFVSGALRPHRLEVVFQDQTFTVRRPPESLRRPSILVRQGLSGLAGSLGELLEPLGDADAIRTKFKIFRISENMQAQRAETLAYFSLFGRGGNRRVEINATWQCTWALGKEQAPRLLRITVGDYEETTARGPGGAPLLADCTAAVLGRNRAFDEQILRGTNHWIRRLDLRAGVDLQGHQGLAVGDVNGDGLDDVYLCQNGGLPNLLFVQNADGTATERSAEAALDLLAPSRGVLLLDFDNDGDQDLAVSSDKKIEFLENDGQMRFRLRAAWQSATRLFSLSAADYDNDGDLDVYACGLVETNEQPLPIPYHDANNGGQNTLLANEGGWRFRDVTNEVGLDQNNTRFSYAASWEDFDNDGDQDLYVANDFGRNNLYRNDVRAGGGFVDVAAQVDAEDIGAGMSAAWGDVNADGKMDLYVSNMFSSAGGRIAFQSQFGGAYDRADKQALRRHARGNTLLISASDGRFEDVSVPAHVTMGRWAWSSSFADLNNDGREDLLVANGYITGDDTKDL